jgi:hypothetical protein
MAEVDGLGEVVAPEEQAARARTRATPTAAARGKRWDIDELLL